MAKSTYFGNSAKLLSVVAALLFAANGFSALGSFFGKESLQSLGTSLSSLVLYVGLILCYVAFNGEGVGHKRYRDRKRKKITGVLKLNLFFCFILNYLKGSLDYTAMSLDGGKGIVARFLMSLVSTVGSYGFLMCAVSFWYIFRDSHKKELLPLEFSAFFFGLLYNLYKLFNYAVGKYQITALGDLFTELFSNNNVLKILCLLQLFFDILMFIQVFLYYKKLGDEEQAVLDNNVKELPRARNVYKDEGYGIDTLEDDFLLSDTIEE